MTLIRDPRSIAPARFRPVRTIALIGLAVAALSLGACGRKTGLDLPPGANVVQQDEAQPVQGTSASQASQTLLEPPGAGKAPVAARGANKRIPLDALIE